MASVNDRLKRLRATANPAISIRVMAEKLGISHATYHNYERPAGFKARFLPMETARRIAAILADHGVNPDEVLALAGIGIDEGSTPALSAGEELLLERWRALTSTQRRLIHGMINELTGQGSLDDNLPGTMHSPTLAFNPQDVR